MAAKYQQDEVQGYPLAPTSIMPRSDAEHANNYNSDEQMRMKKKKRMKCLAYIAVFAVIQITVILILALILLRAKTPKVTLEDVAVTSNGSGGDLRVTARVLIKNKNFGRYKFDDTFATVRSGSDNMGQFLIGEGRARARSTRKRAVMWDLRSLNRSSGSLDLIVEARLRGKVQLLRVIKRRKSAAMNCTMAIDLARNAVQNLRCH